MLIECLNADAGYDSESNHRFTPTIVRLLRHTELLHDLPNRLTLGNLDLRFTQLADDLLCLKAFLGHPEIPLENVTKPEF